MGSRAQAERTAAEVLSPADLLEESLTWPRYLRVQAGSFATQHRVPPDLLAQDTATQARWLAAVVDHLAAIATEQWPGLVQVWRVVEAGDQV